MCCHVASYASATSGSLPTAVAPACCPSASNCRVLQPHSGYQQSRSRHLHRPRTGVARFVADRCASSNESPRLNYCFDLRPRVSGAQHEPVLPISTLRRSSVRTGKSRLISGCKEFLPPSSLLAPPCRTQLRPIISAEPLNEGSRQSRFRDRPRSSAHSNYISVRRRSGFLQVDVSEAPPITEQPPRRATFTGAPDTSQRLPVPDRPR